MKIASSIALAIIIISFALGIFFYPQMPEQMASHWNSQGEVDGYMTKNLAVFLMPAISFALLVLFILIPKIDPLKENFKKFQKYYEGFIILMILFLFYVYSLSLLWNAGFNVNINKMTLPALGILFFYAGMLMENAKKNWFVGIRTPWTLSNDIVWEKTNKLGGKLFKIAGIIAFTGILLPNYVLLLVLVPIILFSVYIIFYSYLEYQKQIKK